MQDKFFAIRLILRHGELGAILIAVISVVIAIGLLWSVIGWFSLPAGLLIGGLVFLLAKSYVEIVGIVFQMVH